MTTDTVVWLLLLVACLALWVVGTISPLTSVGRFRIYTCAVLLSALVAGPAIGWQSTVVVGALLIWLSAVAVGTVTVRA
jgi:hypothetical protein